MIVLRILGGCLGVFVALLGVVLLALSLMLFLPWPIALVIAVGVVVWVFIVVVRGTRRKAAKEAADEVP